MLQGQRYPYMLYQCPSVLNFSQFYSTDNRLELMDRSRHLQQIIPKWPWTLKGQRYPKSQISMIFAVLELQTILRKKYTNWPQNCLPWILRGQKVPHIYSASTPSPLILFVQQGTSYGSFLSYRPFCYKPKMTLNATRSNTSTVILVSPVGGGGGGGGAGGGAGGAAAANAGERNVEGGGSKN